MRNILDLFGFDGLFGDMFDSLWLPKQTVSDMYANLNRFRMLSYHIGIYSHNKEAAPESTTTLTTRRKPLSQTSTDGVKPYMDGAFVDNSSVFKPIRTFHLFPLLPPELQLQIWDHALCSCFITVEEFRPRYSGTVTVNLTRLFTIQKVLEPIPKLRDVRQWMNINRTCWSGRKAALALEREIYRQRVTYKGLGSMVEVTLRIGWEYQTKVLKKEEAERYVKSTDDENKRRGWYA